MAYTVLLLFTLVICVEPAPQKRVPLLVQVSSCYADFRSTDVDGLRGPPQGIPSPYYISVPEYYFGEPLNVSIITTGSSALRGILLQARYVDDDDIVGTWKVVDPARFRTISCGGLRDSAVTHTDGADKPSINTFMWTGSTSLNHIDREVYIMGTFLQSTATYWMGEKSSSIRVVARRTRAAVCDDTTNRCMNGGTCLRGDNTQCQCPHGYGSDFGEIAATTPVCPEDIRVGLSPGESNKQVHWTLPENNSTDICPLNTTGGQSGEFFKRGSTTVTVFRQGYPEFNCTFTVTVVRPTTPVCPASITFELLPGASSEEVTWTFPANNDTDVLPLNTTGGQSGDSFEPGSTTVTVFREGYPDISCTFTVTGVASPPGPGEGGSPSGLSPGAIAGIVIAVLVLLIAAIAIFVYMRSKRRSTSDNPN